MHDLCPVLLSLLSLNEIPGAKTFEVPFDIRGVPIVNKYVERDREMSAVESSLRPGVANTQRRILVLHGLGGTGKTQLSLAYARKHRDNHTAIVWLNGQTQDSLKQSIAGIARSLPANQLPNSASDNLQQESEGLEKAIGRVLEWFGQPGNTQWLLIYDNVDRDASDEVHDPEAYDIRKYFPNSDHGSIIITTRRLQLRNLGDGVKVNTMTTEEGMELLRNTLGDSRHGKSILFEMRDISDEAKGTCCSKTCLYLGRTLEKVFQPLRPSPYITQATNFLGPWRIPQHCSHLVVFAATENVLRIAHTSNISHRVDGSNRMLTCHRHLLCDNTTQSLGSSSTGSCSSRCIYPRDQ